MTPATAEPSLGEILGLALADPKAEARALEERARNLSAFELSRQLAPLLHTTQADVFEALTYVPDAMLVLLQSPGGWTALADHIASDFGQQLPDFMPTLH